MVEPARQLNVPLTSEVKVAPVISGWLGDTQPPSVPVAWKSMCLGSSVMPGL